MTKSKYILCYFKFQVSSSKLPSYQDSIPLLYPTHGPQMAVRNGHAVIRVEFWPFHYSSLPILIA